MDRFRALSAFVAVVNEGAFNAAARRLDLSPQAVTRLVTQLEAALGVRLLNRTTRHLALTEAGRRLHADAQRILADLAAAEASAAGVNAAPSGLLRVTAPVLFGEQVVLPLLRLFLEDHPAVAAEALLLDRNVDLIDEGIDVAVRIGVLPDSGLSATRVGAARRVLVAAPAYLAERGVPTDPDDLKDQRIVYATTVSGDITWEFCAQGRRRRVRLAPALRVNSMRAAIDAAREGWGVSRVLSYQVADDLAAGRLCELLADCEDRLLPIHLLQAEGRQAAAKIRSFVDFAAPRLRQRGDHFLAR